MPIISLLSIIMIVIFMSTMERTGVDRWSQRQFCRSGRTNNMVRLYSMPIIEEEARHGCSAVRVAAYHWSSQREADFGQGTPRANCEFPQAHAEMSEVIRWQMGDQISDGYTRGRISGGPSRTEAQSLAREKP